MYSMELLIKEIEIEIAEFKPEKAEFNQLAAMQEIENQYIKEMPPPVVVETVVEVATPTTETDDFAFVAIPPEILAGMLKGYNKNRKKLAESVIHWAVSTKPTDFKDVRAKVVEQWEVVEGKAPSYYAVQNFTQKLLTKLSPIIEWGGKAASPLEWR